VIENPCEKYSASPGLRFALMDGQTTRWAASLSSTWMIVPRRTASSIGKSVLPGFQPSATARSQSRLNSGAWPTMTLKPLSRRFSPCAGPCTP